MKLAQFPSSVRFVACTFLGLAVHAAATAAVLTAPTQAEMRAKRAVAQIQARGADSAYELMQSDASLKGSDNYIAIIDLHGVLLSHSGDPALVGRSVQNLKDPGCLELGKLVVAASAPVSGLPAAAPSMGCLTLDAPMHRIRLETAYVQRVGDRYLVLGVSGAWADGDEAVNVSEGW